MHKLKQKVYKRGRNPKAFERFQVHKLKQKGFIGPIGDDLPSLIPLLFGLLMFFSVFGFAFSVLDSRKSFFQDDLDALRIAEQLKGNSYVVDAKQFTEQCEAITITRLNFVAGIIPIEPQEGEAKETIFSIVEKLVNEKDNADALVCANSKEIFSFERISGKKIISRVFSIAVEKKNSKEVIIVKPMRLIVVVWK